jgi:hypothetical protein
MSFLIVFYTGISYNTDCGHSGNYKPAHGCCVPVRVGLNRTDRAEGIGAHTIYICSYILHTVYFVVLLLLEDRITGISWNLELCMHACR